MTLQTHVGTSDTIKGVHKHRPPIHTLNKQNKRMVELVLNYDRRRSDFLKTIISDKSFINSEDSTNVTSASGGEKQSEAHKLVKIRQI